MKRTKNSLGMLSRLSAGVVPLLMAALTLPLLVLAGLGLVSVFQNDYWLLLSLVLAGSALLVLIGYLSLQRRRANVEAMTDFELEGDYQVAPSGEWGSFEREVWQAVNRELDARLDKTTTWPSLRELGTDLAMEVAGQYHPERQGKALAFTAPEFLLMLENVSQRYRRFLLNHVPFAEQLKLSTLKQGYLYKEKLDTAKQVYDVYRLFRLVTPAGWIAEARGQVLGYLFDEVNVDVQYKLKKVLMQEVISVAIDLYSGRFALADDELGGSHGHEIDQSHLAAEIEPLRVALLGQISAGKSSLINAFIGNLVAEVNAIPTTDSVVIHKCEVEGIDCIHLVDLPGIDGTEANQKLLLKQVTNSDVVLWVVKANQPARQLDVAFKQELDVFYQQPEHRSRKRPKIIMLLNQVDRLSPVTEWDPPYRLDQPTNRKAENIQAALAYNIAQLQPDDAVVIAMPDQQPAYQLEKVGESLLAAFEDGVNTQLNRRRLEHARGALGDQAKRLYRLSKVALSQWFT